MKFILPRMAMITAGASLLIMSGCKQNALNDLIHAKVGSANPMTTATPVPTAAPITTPVAPAATPAPVPVPTVAPTATPASPTPAPNACSGKRINVEKGVDNGKYFDGASYAYSPGDTFVLKASGNPYSYFAIKNIHGTADCPVTITNEGGQVMLTSGIAVEDSSYVKVDGSGSASDKYGFLIDASAGDKSGVGINIYGRSAHVEAHHAQIQWKMYGFWSKEEANCDPNYQYPNWIIDDISIHDNSISNVSQSGMYLGSTAPNGERAIVCNGVSTNPLPLRLGTYRIYNNIVNHTGRTGIQLSDAETGDSEIYGNTITNTGYELNTQQGSGISLGGYTHAYVHDNTIDHSFNAGILALGSKLIRIENNHIDHSGNLDAGTAQGMAGIMVDTRPTTPLERLTFWIKNNTIGSNTDVAVRVYKTYDAYNTDNIICNTPGSTAIDGSVVYSTTCQ